MARNNTKNKLNVGGRPTLYSQDMVSKLESIFKIGGTVEQAITYAGISKETYYTWGEKHIGFLTKMEQARTYADIVAKNIVVDSMIKDRDVSTAKWWLEKREFKQIIQNNTQINVAPSQLLVEFLESKPNEQQNPDNANTN